MNQPTREEFEAFKREIRQEVRQLKEQRTEEMKAIRVDVHNVDVEAIRQELKTVSDTWLSVLQEHYTEHKEDLATLKTAQIARFDQIEAEQKEQHAMLRQILRLLGQGQSE